MTEQGRSAFPACGRIAPVFMVARRTLDHLYRFARYFYFNVIQPVRAVAAAATGTEQRGLLQ
jgi:hypothetical protein